MNGNDRTYPETHSIGVAMLMIKERVRAIHFRLVTPSSYVYEEIYDEQRQGT
jgi:hypothetical protein